MTIIDLVKKSVIDAKTLSAMSLDQFLYWAKSCGFVFKDKK